MFGTEGWEGRVEGTAELAVHHSSGVHGLSENREINKTCGIKSCSFLSGHCSLQEASSPQPLMGSS